MAKEKLLRARLGNGAIRTVRADRGRKLLEIHMPHSDGRFIVYEQNYRNFQQWERETFPCR